MLLENSTCFSRQEKGLPDLLKWAWARRGSPSTGGLINHPRPSLADFARAFPIAPANYTAMASPPGAHSVSELQYREHSIMPKRIDDIAHDLLAQMTL